MSQTATKRDRWASLNARIEACTACERLLAHCRRVAREKRAAYRSETYWGRPVANFGDPHARLLIVGLAPGAHGANRTGRLFTGDSSGDWLYRALHRAGFANQPHAVDRNDGLELIDCAITGVAHCAPPDNKPARGEIENCRHWLHATIDGAAAVQVYVALGGIAWVEFLRAARQRQWLAAPAPKFAHGAVASLTRGRRLIGSYHPSRQNTNTGRLTEQMLDDIFTLVRCELKPRRRKTRASQSEP